MSKKRLKDFSETIPLKGQTVEAKTMYPKTGREDCIPNKGCKVVSHNCSTPHKGDELAPMRLAGRPKGKTLLTTGKSLKREKTEFPLSLENKGWRKVLPYLKQKAIPEDQREKPDSKRLTKPS